LNFVSDLEALQTRLGYHFRDGNLLRLSLTHPSLAYEAPGITPHNQRLEFLGDAVLGLVLTEELYEKFPNCEEGPLTKARAQMVNRRTLAEEARRLDLGECLLLSRGEESSGGRQRPSSLADAYEALVGAIFLDCGYEAAQDFILSCFRDAFGQLTEIPNLENPKGELQELLQAQSPDAPQYQVASIRGPDHDRVFECVVFHHGTELGRGQGKNKKAAESQAAQAALEFLRRTAPAVEKPPRLAD
jgi:ribonuclease III